MCNCLDYQLVVVTQGQAALTNEAVVALGVLDAQLVLNHPARGRHRLGEAEAHLQGVSTPEQNHNKG